MRSWLEKVILLVVCFCVVAAGAVAQTAPTLGAMYEFGALASSSITNTDSTVVQAKVGGTTGAGNLTGFPPGVAELGIHPNDALAQKAVSDARAAMTFMASRTGSSLPVGNLGGLTITPGVYTISGDAILNGKLTFNGQDQDAPVFIIKVTGSLDIVKAEYELSGGAAGINLFWLVEGDVTVRKSAAALGNIFSISNITMEDGAQLQGRLAAISTGSNGKITLSNNVITHPADLEVTLTKEPGSRGRDTYAFGEEVTYYIRVKNNGPTNAENVVVSGEALTGVILRQFSTDPTVTFSGSSWSIGDLDYKEEIIITVVTKTNKAGIRSSMVSVEGTTVDEIHTNNTSSLNFCVLVSETGVISGPTEVCLSNEFVYSISPVDGATSYAWSVPSGWSFTPIGTPGTATSIRVKVGSAPTADRMGFVKVTASNTCGEGPARTLDIMIQSDVPQQPGPVTGPEAICRGATGLTYSIAPVANATSYTWILPAGWAFASGQGTTMTGSNLTEVIVNPGDNSGTITVIASNACGDSEPQTKYVQVDDATPDAPTSITGTQQGCVDTVVPYEVGEVPTAVEYLWEVPADGGWAIVSGNGTSKVMVRVGSTAGNITVRAKNGCGVSEPFSKFVEPVTSPSPAPGPITGDVYTCVNQTGLEYSVEEVPTALWYEWSLPEGWEIVSGHNTNKIVVNAKANGGEISVIAWNDCGESDPSTLTVIPTEDVPQQLGPITGGQYGCVGKTTTYSVEEADGVNFYQWEVPNEGGWAIVSGQGTTSIEVLAGSTNGKISVTAVNGCGSGAMSTLDVVPQTAPPAAPTPIIGPAEVCEGRAGYEFRVNPVVGVNYYEWNVPEGWIITEGQGTARIVVTAGAEAGTVTVKGENDCGEGAEASLTVTVVPSPPDQPGDITGPPSVCIGQQGIEFSIEPVAFASSYIWSVGENNGWVIVSGHGTTRIVVNAGPEPTIISVRAVNACGVTGETQLATIMTSEKPAMPGPITGETVPCAGGTYTFSIGEVETAYKYNWYFPEGWKVIEDNGISISVETNGTGGTVRVSAENGCGPGGEQTLQVAPSTVPPAAPLAILGDLDACADKEATFYVEEVNEASEYIWDLPQGWSFISGEGTASVVLQVGTVPGTISVTTKNGCGVGGSVSREINLNTAPPAAPGPITGAPLVCTKSTFTYSIEPVNTASSYFWQVPTGWRIISGQGTTSIEVEVGTTTGDVGSVSVTAINSCGDSGTTKLAVNASDDTAITIGAITGPATTFCENTEGLTYSIEPVNGAVSYEWTVPADWTITAGRGTTSITVTAGTEAGDVTVTAKNACGNGSTGRKAVMSQTTPLTPEISLGSVNPCQGVTTTYSVTASATGNVDTYIWEVPKGWEIVSGHNTSTIEVLVNGTAGKIRVTAKNSCSESGTAEMEVIPSPALPETPSAIVGTPEVCAGGTVTYSVQNPSVGATYEWTTPEGWEILSGQGEATITVRTAPGTGTVTVKGTNGCGTTAPASLDVAAMAEGGVTSIKDLSTPCVGLSYEVEPVPGATNYTWTVPAGWTITSGQGTTTITVTSGFGNGDISVVASNGGCTDGPVYYTPNPTFANSELHFPNVFSPNSDGTHDLWEIRNLTNYPDNEVTIINRWGNQVYHSKSYKNNWNGDNLSEGTYFYVVRVKLCDGQDKMFKGYVMIVR
ncbi:ice-binding family protein [Pontibacter kalidii]|uniref:ice-binding family protein n=1 Tax=Pontibacter kalidii TaxID=2592049 RepID=UPI00224FCD55|nr:ice-binding family protein [Pontibacter kalidii]